LLLFFASIWMDGWMDDGGMRGYHRNRVRPKRSLLSRNHNI
jgi:hypothetical protein